MTEKKREPDTAGGRAARESVFLKKKGAKRKKEASNNLEINAALPLKNPGGEQERESKRATERELWRSAR